MPVDPYHIYNPDDPSVSKSELDLINKSPALYYHQVVQGHRSTESRALLFGQAFHAAILEPMEFEDWFAVMPADLAAMDKRKKEGKEALAAWKAAQLDPDGNLKSVLSAPEGAAIEGMTKSIFANPCARSLIERTAQVEKAHYFRDPKHGVKLRAKPDFVTGGGIICDLKSTSVPLLDWHAKAAEKWRYDVQAAMYTKVLQGACDVDVDDFLFIVVEKTAPYDCAVFGLEDEDLAHGWDEMEIDIGVYAECLASGQWPQSFAGQQLPLRRSLPGWRRNRLTQFQADRRGLS